ncbi:unnamed protein product [Durusdinium trenchii]|uniref:NADPH-dependent FMN reductase-like domain-containing protein n=1 Tax=Durusdinium trenchii TaxID=1381693 RepID=A0ABP0N2A7_9DINO
MRRFCVRSDPSGLLQVHPRPLEFAKRRLLVVWHSRTGMAEQMAESLRTGAHDAIHDMEATAWDLAVDLRRAQDAQVFDLLSADGFLFCAPENLATVSGEMKEFFDRCYYGAQGRLNGRPYALAISAGSDGFGAAAQLERICRGWRLRPVAEPVVMRSGAQSARDVAQAKVLDERGQLRCRELGALIAAHLLLET